jgi:hypothetical protein
MGAPTSAILAETFIQYLEHTAIINILNKYHIIDYYRYVDDILIIYNTQTTISDVLEMNLIRYTLRSSSQQRKNQMTKSIIQTQPF